jgi:chromosomal replication initiator protein
MNARDLQVRRATIEGIQQAVAVLFGLFEGELTQRSTRRTVTVPRQIAMYLAKQTTDASLPRSARHFSGRCPKTVMYAIAKIEEQRATDGDLEHVRSRLLKTLNRS